MSAMINSSSQMEATESSTPSPWTIPESSPSTGRSRAHSTTRPAFLLPLLAQGCARSPRWWLLVTNSGITRRPILNRPSGVQLARLRWEREPGKGGSKGDRPTNAVADSDRLTGDGACPRGQQEGDQIGDLIGARLPATARRHVG